MKNTDSKISIVFAITALNCQNTIVPTLRSLQSAIKECGLQKQSEIVLVDDGSLDKTYQVAAEFIRVKSNNFLPVTLLRNSKPAGLSNSFVTAAQLSRCSHLIPVAGSNPVSIEGWITLLKDIAPNTITIGYRKNLWLKRPPIKALASRILNGIFLPLAGFTYHELTCAFILPRQDVVDFLPKSAGHGFGFYFVTGAEIRGRNLKETWIKMNDQRFEGTSKIPNPKHGWQILKGLVLAKNHARNCVQRNL